MFAQGITSLGKYTLPKSLALPIKVDELPLRQLEKNGYSVDKITAAVTVDQINMLEADKERLYNSPQGSKHSLLIGVFKITLYEQHYKVTVLPNLTKIKLKKFSFWRNFRYLVIFQAFSPFCRYFTYKNFITFIFLCQFRLICRHNNAKIKVNLFMKGI